MPAANLNLRQLLLTDPILNAANTLRRNKPTLNRTRYAKERGEQGFRLSRINRMRAANLNRLLDAEPIVVAAKPRMGRRINGNMKQLYTIQNGRHRVARALANNRATIRADIRNHPDAKN